MTDPLTQLSELRSAEPTPARAARIHRRCRAELARRPRQAHAGAARPGQVGGSRLWQTAVASLCVAYVVEVIVLAADVLRSR